MRIYEWLGYSRRLVRMDTRACKAATALYAHYGSNEAEANPFLFSNASILKGFTAAIYVYYLFFNGHTSSCGNTKTCAALQGYQLSHSNCSLKWNWWTVLRKLLGNNFQKNCFVSNIKHIEQNQTNEFKIKRMQSKTLLGQAVGAGSVRLCQNWRGNS